MTLLLEKGTWMGFQCNHNGRCTYWEKLYHLSRCGNFCTATRPKYNGEETLTVIGDNTTIRECVTINRGTLDRQKTEVGKNCLIMAYCHIAHDCVVGSLFFQQQHSSRATLTLATTLSWQV